MTDEFRVWASHRNIGFRRWNWTIVYSFHGTKSLFYRHEKHLRTLLHYIPDHSRRIINSQNIYTFPDNYR